MAYLYEKKGFLAEIKNKLKRLRSFKNGMPVYQQLSLFKYVLGLSPGDRYCWSLSEQEVAQENIKYEIWKLYESIDESLRDSLDFFDFQGFFLSHIYGDLELWKVLEIHLLMRELSIVFKSNFSGNDYVKGFLIKAYKSKKLDLIFLEADRLKYLVKVRTLLSLGSSASMDLNDSIINFAAEQFDNGSNNSDIIKAIRRINNRGSKLPVGCSFKKISARSKILAGKVKGFVKRYAGNDNKAYAELIGVLREELPSYKLSDSKQMSKALSDGMSAKWWEKQLKRFSKVVEYDLARFMGLIGLGRSPHNGFVLKSSYVPQFLFNNYCKEMDRIDEYMSSSIFVSFDGKKKSLKDLRQTKEKGRAAEDALFARGQSIYCQKIRKMAAFFLTVTLPPSYHAQRRVCRGDVQWTEFNPSFRGKTIADCFSFFELNWKRFRAQMQKKLGPGGWAYYGAVELHCDGTPHWHIVMYFNERYESIVADLVNTIFVLQRSRKKKEIEQLENGVLLYQSKFERFKQEYGPEVYVVKMIDRAKRSSDEMKKMDCFFSIHKKRRIFSSEMCKGVWRALRYIDDPDLLSDDLRRAWHCARGVRQYLPRLRTVVEAHELLAKGIFKRKFKLNSSCTADDVVAFLLSPAACYKKHARCVCPEVNGDYLSSQFDIPKSVSDVLLKNFNVADFYRVVLKTGEVFKSLFVKRKWRNFKKSKSLSCLSSIENQSVHDGESNDLFSSGSELQLLIQSQGKGSPSVKIHGNSKMQNFSQGFA